MVADHILAAVGERASVLDGELVLLTWAGIRARGVDNRDVELSAVGDVDVVPDAVLSGRSKALEVEEIDPRLPDRVTGVADADVGEVEVRHVVAVDSVLNGRAADGDVAEADVHGC